jgi:uncharacterized protein (DUF849 family)
VMGAAGGHVSAVRLKACLNGGSVGPGVPMTPAELAADAAEAWAAGCFAVHVHPRDCDGRETIEPDACAAVIGAIRKSSPGLPIGLTTGLWTTEGVADRWAKVDGWTVAPDFASVAFSEPDAEEVTELLLSKGIPVEVGVWTMDDVEKLVASGVVERCIRVIIEPTASDPKVALAAGLAMQESLNEANVAASQLLHGEQDTAWPLLQAAAALGLELRIGFEDVMSLPTGVPATSNRELVGEALRLIEHHDEGTTGDQAD